LVIDTNKQCATIQAQTGLLFDGSLNHAGARVNYAGCRESVITQEVELIIRKHIGKPETIFNQLCSIEGLGSISRLHVSLFTKGKKIFQDPNSVGRDGCPINPEF